MKKILSLFIVAMAVVSCTFSSKDNHAENSDSTQVASEITAGSFAANLDKLLSEGDTAKIQQLIGDANKYCAELAKNDQTGAANLLEQIKKTLSENADRLRNVGLNADALANKATELSGDVKNAVISAADSIEKAEADQAVEDAKSAVSKAASDIKDAAADKAKEVSNKAKEGAENLKKNAQEGIGKAKEKIANSANQTADAIRDLGKK